ncbi:putative multiple-sugar transport system permease YteP [compost metagenome]
MLVLTDVWKGFGYGSIIYLASLTAIDPGLYEASSIDGANRFKQLWHITLPGLMPTILLVTTLNLPNVLNAGFDQIFNLYNPLVYATSDIIDTYVYRVGLVERQYSLGTAIGLLRSVVGIVLILSANKLAQKLTDYRIF